MEVKTLNPILKYSREDVKVIRREVNIDERNIAEIMKSIEEWYKMQKHMTKENLDADFLERVIVVLARGSPQQTKTILEAVATVKTALPEFYADRDVDSLEFKQLAKFAKCVPLPVLNKDLTRIVFIRISARSINHEDIFNPLTFYKLVTLINENRLYIDYSAGETYVIDMKHFKMADFAVFNVGLMKKVHILTSAYKARIKGIHFINVPSYIDKVVFLLKQGLKEKLASRIQVHATLAEFQKKFPKDCLPSDYGGSLKSYDELNEEFMNYLCSETSKRHSEDANLFKTDESKRVGGKIDEEMLGIPGSFRKIDVD